MRLRAADSVKDYRAIKRCAGFLLESRQDTEHMVLGGFFFFIPSVTTDSGQSFLLICTKSLDENPQPSAIGWRCMQMSAEWAELRLCLWEGFKVGVARSQERTRFWGDQEAVPVQSKARVKILQMAFLCTSKGNHKNMCVTCHLLQCVTVWSFRAVKFSETSS